MAVPTLCHGESNGFGTRDVAGGTDFRFRGRVRYRAPRDGQHQTDHGETGASRALRHVDRGAGIRGAVLGAAARAADQVSPPKQAWHWHLTGVLLGPDLREALFATDDETRVVPQGAQIDGWTVTDVHPGEVTLRQADEEKRLSTEWLPDNQRAVADSLRRERIAEAAIAVQSAQDRQNQDQAAGEQALVNATAQMMRLKSIRR